MKRKEPCTYKYNGETYTPKITLDGCKGCEFDNHASGCSHAPDCSINLEASIMEIIWVKAYSELPLVVRNALKVSRPDSLENLLAEEPKEYPKECLNNNEKYVVYFASKIQKEAGVESHSTPDRYIKRHFMCLSEDEIEELVNETYGDNMEQAVQMLVKLLKEGEEYPDALWRVIITHNVNYDELDVEYSKLLGTESCS